MKLQKGKIEQDLPDSKALLSLKAKPFLQSLRARRAKEVEQEMHLPGLKPPKKRNQQKLLKVKTK